MQLLRKFIIEAVEDDYEFIKHTWTNFYKILKNSIDFIKSGKIKFKIHKGDLAIQIQGDLIDESLKEHYFLFGADGVLNRDKFMGTNMITSESSPSKELTIVVMQASKNFEDLLDSINTKKATYESISSDIEKILSSFEFRIKEQFFHEMLHLFQSDKMSSDAEYKLFHGPQNKKTQKRHFKRFAKREFKGKTNHETINAPIDNNSQGLESYARFSDVLSKADNFLNANSKKDFIAATLKNSYSDLSHDAKKRVIKILSKIWDSKH